MRKLTVDQFFALAGKDRDAISDWMERNDVPRTTFEIEIVSEQPPHAIARYFRANGRDLQFDKNFHLKTNEMHVFELPPIPPK